MLLFGFSVNAQEITVSGTVTSSEDGLSMPGVSIVVEGTTNGTSTDFDGNYSITANVGDQLTFSFIGYAPKTVSVTGASLNVTLETDAAQLDEVVVMGFSSRKKSELTGSAVQVNSDQLELVPVTSVDQALQGRVAGVAINTTSGTPGSAQQIRIRGISSITAGNEPLYVIDGVPVTNNVVDDGATSTLTALSSLNAANIESITVLKDATSTAPYGARGANGVIVITTKKGRAGKTQFNFSSSYGISNDAVAGPTMLTAAQQEELWYDAMRNSYGVDYDKDSGYGTGFAFNDDWVDAGRPEADWGAAIINKDAPTYDMNFSARGGDATSNFYASLGYMNTEATVIGSTYERITGTLNYSRNMSETVTFSTNNSIAKTTQDGMLEQSAYFSSPRMVRFFGNPTTPIYNDDGTLNLNTGSARNPLYLAENEINLTNITRIISNNSLTWRMPVKGLSFTTRYSIDWTFSDRKEYGNRNYGDAQADGGSAYRWHNSNVNFVVQNSLDYTFTKDVHSFDVKLQQEYQKNANTDLDAYGTGFAADGLTNLANVAVPESVGSSYYDWAIGSYTASANYIYDNKYVINGTFRREGSSRFAEENRWGSFWSTGLAWNIHREGFLENASFISNLKLRGSYGVTGNSSIGLNSYQTMLGFDSNYNESAGIYPSVFGNSNLTWETQSTMEFGLDFGFFDNRFSGSVSYYKRTSDDLLLNVPLSRTTGFSSQTANIGTMWNKGIEFEANVDIVRSENFNVSFGGYVATNENQVVELAKDPNGNARTITGSYTKVDEGHQVYEYYLVKFAGVDPQTGVNTYYLNGSEGATTTNFSEAERAFQGKSGLPTLTAGLNLHVDFMGVFLDANGYYSGGNFVIEGWHRYVNSSDAYIFAFNSSNNIMDRWQKPGDETNVEKIQYTYKPWERHTNYVHEGDYFRLKNLTLGYNLPSNLMSSIGFESASIFVRGTNMYTWVKDKDLTFDPETGPNGNLGLTTPPLKTYSIGVNLNF
jgi:TonB-linked SusC/RagA family outer membrane protein